MDRFVVREPRSSAEYPQGNQMIAFPANAATGSNMIPETMYFSGPFASEYQHDQRINVPHNVNAQLINVQPNINAHHNINAQHNIMAPSNNNAQHNMNVSSNMNAQLNISAQQSLNAQQNINAQFNMNAQHSVDAQQNINAQLNMRAQHNMKSQPNIHSQYNINGQHNMGAQNSGNAQPNMNAQRNMNLQIAQSFGQNAVAGPVSMSGIDPRYYTGYADNSTQFIVTGQQIQRNATPINSFGSDYQNRSFSAIDTSINKHKSLVTHVSKESAKIDVKWKPQHRQMIATSNKKDQIVPKTNPGPSLNKPNELDLLKNDIQNQVMTRADKFKALYRSGPRAFSGPLEKVLKWHKSLQDIGVLVLYEIVAKCVSVRPGESGSKNLVVRDESGPAMQVVYYEIEFLLPELKLPCTIRVIGRMMPGTCRLQAFNVRPATGDDVTTLPRRAAVAAHHVAKLCKEYGPNALA